MYCNDAAEYKKLKDGTQELAALFIVSKVNGFRLTARDNIRATSGITLTVGRAGGEKCARCWVYSDTVGNDKNHPTLCARCAHIV